MSAPFKLTRIPTLKTAADFRARLAVIEIEAKVPKLAMHLNRITLGKTSPAVQK